MGFKKGMLGKFVSNKQANIRKGKGKQKKNKRNPTKSLFLKGVDAQKAKKNGFLKGEDKSKKKQNRKKIYSLRQAICGNKIDKKPLKML